MSCAKCKGTGVISTGNNDLPCDCPAGDTAVFNTSTSKGLLQLPGDKLRSIGVNWTIQSLPPEPAPTKPSVQPLIEVAREAHDEMVARRIFAAFAQHIHVPPELEAKLLALIEKELDKS